MACPFCLQFSKSQLLHPWSIANWKYLTDIIPQIFHDLHVWDGWSKSGFNGIKHPRNQHWINRPPIFDFRCILSWLFDRSINKSIFLLGKKWSPHSPCPFIIILSSQLNLSNYITRIVIQIERIRIWQFFPFFRWINHGFDTM